MAQTVIVISGASRGLGRALLAHYLALPAHTLIALNRTPSGPDSLSLSSLPVGAGSKLIVLKTDSTVEADAFAAVKQLAAHDITHIDLVIANAGVSDTFVRIADIKTQDYMRHFTPNVLGVVWLFQATRGLLLAAESPKWATMGSTAGAIVYVTLFTLDQLPINNGIYGSSKATVHWITKRLDAEEEKIAAFVLSPGWVKTEMGNDGAKALGFEEAEVEIDDSIAGMVKVIDSVTKATHGGKLWNYTGEQLQW